MDEGKKDEGFDLPVCGDCAFFNEAFARDKETGKPGKSTGMGFCHANPPELHMIPRQQKVAMGGGGQQMALSPEPYRTAVRIDDLFCRHFFPRAKFAPEEEKCNCGKGEGDACSACQ